MVSRAATLSALAALLLLCGCDKPTAQESAAADARDVAWVEAAQEVKPPLQPLRPEPISPAVRKVYQLTDNGCDFRPLAQAAGDPVLVVGEVKAVLSVRGEPLVLAADSGSPELGAGIHRKYIGRAHWAELSREPGSLTIRDRYERVVYTSTGRFDCRS